LEIKLTTTAKTDLREINRYLVAHFPTKSESTYNAIIKNCELLTQYPQMGRLNEITSARELKVTNLPYYIIYKETAKTLVIYRIYHTSRNPLSP
jgi:toxin ParE1/3/4